MYTVLKHMPIEAFYNSQSKQVKDTLSERIKRYEKELKDCEIPLFLSSENIYTKLSNYSTVLLDPTVISFGIRYPILSWILAYSMKGDRVYLVIPNAKSSDYLEPFKDSPYLADSKAIKYTKSPEIRSYLNSLKSTMVCKINLLLNNMFKTQTIFPQYFPTLQIGSIIVQNGFTLTFLTGSKIRYAMILSCEGEELDDDNYPRKVFSAAILNINPSMKNYMMTRSDIAINKHLEICKVIESENGPILFYKTSQTVPVRAYL